MGKARLLFFIFIYSMFAMACSPEPEILSGNNSETEISNGNNNQDEENTNNDNQNNNEENMSNSTIKISVNGTTLTNNTYSHTKRQRINKSFSKSAQRRTSDHKHE